MEKPLPLTSDYKINCYNRQGGKRPMIIKNEQDAHVAYILIAELAKYISTASQQIIALKRDVRAYTKQSDTERIVKCSDSGDYIIKLIKAPDWVLTFEDAHTWFMTEECIKPVYSAYDCTGRAFTSWYKLFQRQNQWYAYHGIAYDV